MIKLFLIRKNVSAKNLVWVQTWQELQSSIIIGVEIDVEQLSFQTFISDCIVNTVDILTLSTVEFLFNMILSIISSKSVFEAGEAFDKLNNNSDFFKMEI